MAGKGSAPAEVRQRGRDNKRTELTWDGTSFWGEDLPEDVPFGGKGGVEGVIVWHPMTEKWWDAWRRWPALEDAHPVMWNYLLATALMVNQMWTNGRWDFAAEIRLREAKFGATPADLRSLGYDYRTEGEGDGDDEGGVKKSGTVTDIESRRMRLVDEGVKKPPAKKAATKKAPVKKAVAKKAPAKKTTAPPRKKAAATPAPPY